MNFEEYLKSSEFKKYATLIFLILFGIIMFGAGVFVGLEKSEFSQKWSDNYYRNFAGQPGQVPMDHDFLNAHGSDGEIIKIDHNTLTLRDEDGVEKNILVDTGTQIVTNRQNLILADLKISDMVVVIGSPNSQGQILAKLIRVMSPTTPPEL